MHTPTEPLPSSPTRRAAYLATALVLAGLAMLVLGAGVGSTGFDRVWAARDDAVAWQIVWDIRLPRTLGAWLVGALLGLAGAVAQGLFRNPLADPFLLGSASGAALGVAVALVLLGGVLGGTVGGSVGGAVGSHVGAMVGMAAPGATWLVRLGLTGAAFGGAVAGVVLTLALARGVQHTLRLLLAGVIVGVVLSATKDLITLAAPDILQAMQGFTLGSTGYIGWESCLVMAAVWLPVMLVAWALAPVLDGLSLGESTARSLGLPLGPMRAVLIAVLALATGTAVAQAGLISFVGLAAPHLVRSLRVGTHGRLLLLSSLTGGLLLMAADLLARWLIAPQELPVGVLTAVLGGSYLLWLMHQRNRSGVL